MKKEQTLGVATITYERLWSGLVRWTVDVAGTHDIDKGAWNGAESNMRKAVKAAEAQARVANAIAEGKRKRP